MVDIIEGAEELCTIIDSPAKLNGLVWLEKTAVLYVSYGAHPCHEALKDYTSTDFVKDYLRDNNLKLHYFDTAIPDLNDLAREMDIIMVPTLGIYTQGVEINRHVGQLSRHELVRFLDGHLDKVLDFSHS